MSEDIDRMLEYTEDVQRAIEVLKKSEQFHLVTRQGEGWYTFHNGAPLQLIAVIEVAKARLMKEIPDESPDDDDS